MVIPYDNFLRHFNFLVWNKAAENKFGCSDNQNFIHKKINEIYHFVLFNSHLLFFTHFTSCTLDTLRKKLWVRLNYATTYRHLPPPTTNQNISTTTTHHQPKYIHHHPAKAKLYSCKTLFWHRFNSFFFFEIRYSFTWRTFCVIKFWSVRFLNSKLLLHFTRFEIF